MKRPLSRIAIALASSFMLVVSLSGTVQAQFSASYDLVKAKFDPFGAYTTARVPRELAEFGSFQIDLVRKDVKRQALEIAGVVYTQQEGLTPSMKTITLTLKALAFETETVNGINYSFSGQFLRSGAFSKLPRKTAVLEGLLKKSVNGRAVVESKLRFFYIEPD